MSGALDSFGKTGLEWWFHPWRSRKYVTCWQIPRDAVAPAERLDLHEIAALDRRDFQVVAPRHLRKGDRLRLLPDN